MNAYSVRCNLWFSGMEMSVFHYNSTSFFLTTLRGSRSSGIAQIHACAYLLSCYERVQQQTPPGYALVFRTCLSAGKGFHLCCSSHRQCPDGPNEELWQTPWGMQLQYRHLQIYRRTSVVESQYLLEEWQRSRKRGVYGCGWKKKDIVSVREKRLVYRDTYRLYLPMLLRSANWLSVTCLV